MKKRPDDEEDVPTLATQAAGESEQGMRRFTLVVGEGPGAGTRFEIDGSTPNRCYAGKSRSCDFRLEDPLASRRHFAFEVSRGGLRIEDLESTNGTRVNGVKVHAVTLSGGETITVGGTIVRVIVADAPGGAKLPAATAFGRVLGTSAVMRRLYPLCAKLAASSVPVLIEGETGVGKELMAESLHEQGKRPDAAFVVFDCTTVAPSLVEATLFGHERGAFTGADRQRIGVFEQAHGGTLFIDEIGDLELPLQARLLRAIERSEVCRVGGNVWSKVDVRIICATRRDLEEEIQQRRFREDLFYRLAVARLELPPLRHREGDVTFLARHFWNQLAGEELEMPAGMLERLQRYHWPGNVRELYNAIARGAALGDLDHPLGVRPGFLPAGVTVAPAVDTLQRILDQELPFARARERVYAEFQRMYVERALEAHGGNAAEAAAASGISRRYFDMIRRSGSQKAGES
jgi:two-component system, NtrC family, response regulator HydG